MLEDAGGASTIEVVAPPHAINLGNTLCGQHLGYNFSLLTSDTALLQQSFWPDEVRARLEWETRAAACCSSSVHVVLT